MPDRRATILGSFAYFARTDLAKLCRRARERGVEVDFMADSGAFTAYTTGKPVSLKGYAAWLQVYAPHINCAMTLDVIGDPAASGRNTLDLQQLVGDDVYIIPIFHIGSPWEELERWCETHPFVALGGGVAVNARGKAMMQWLVRAHKIARAYGTVLHGLGMTRPPYPDLLPFYSVDSSFWHMSARKGAVTLFDDRKGAWVCVRHPDIRQGPEYVTRARANPAYARLIRSYGGDPEHVADFGFGRVSKRGSQGREDRAWMIAAAMESSMRYTDHLATRRTVPAPGPVRWDGPKVYLAAVAEDQFDLMVDVAAHRARERTPA